MDLGRKLREITVTPAVIPIPQRETRHGDVQLGTILAEPETKEAPEVPVKTDE